MYSMFVTLVVSKLSGWLNAYAFCTGSKEGACDSGRDADRTAGGRWVLGAAQAARTRRDQLKAAWGHGASAERTLTKRCMFVTLDVSKVSGWLNAVAYCRESKGGHTVRGELRVRKREMADDGGARSVQGRARL